MSATLGVLLHRLDSGLKIQIIESLAEIARESSNPWNNAGTGHAALCELNYTPERPDGSIDISKALQIHEAFEISKQFWAHLVDEEILPDPANFIMRTPHMSFVRGEADVDFLRRRHEAMTRHHFFAHTQFAANRQRVKEWAPLLLEGRDKAEPIAATRANDGTDVNFGALTEALVDYLAEQEKVKIATHHRVTNLTRTRDGRWKLTVRNLSKEINRTITTPFVFVGAGGASLPLLQNSGIPEGSGFGGFPVSGQFLVCNNPEIVNRHHAKVYGKAPVGAPPMSPEAEPSEAASGKDGASETPAKVENFIARWSQSGASERANYQLFLSELCTILGVPLPDPSTPDDQENTYVFGGRGTRQVLRGCCPNQ